MIWPDLPTQTAMPALAGRNPAAPTQKIDGIPAACQSQCHRRRRQIGRRGPLSRCLNVDRITAAPSLRQAVVKQSPR